MTVNSHRNRHPNNEEDPQPLEALMREARRLGQKGDWGPRATQINTRILELDPDNLPALTRRARCFFEQDDYPAARKDYVRVLELYPGSKLVQEALAKIDRGWDASQERKQRKTARARRKIKRALSDAAELRRLETLTSFEDARALGIAATAANPPNYPLAIAAFKKAYALDPRGKLRSGQKPPPGLFEVPIRLARVFRKSGEHYKAQRMYEWILARYDSPAAKVGLAAVHEDKRRHSVALGLYEEVLSQNPDNPYALRGITRTLSSLDRIDEAVEAYGKALERAESPNDAAAAASGLSRTRKQVGRGDTHSSVPHPPRS